MKTLKRSERKNVECVRCHATEKVIGTAPKTKDDFHLDQGVGCESCHGSGKDHVAQPSKDNIVGLGDSCPVCVIESVCTSCHTKEWDPTWDLRHPVKGAC